MTHQTPSANQPGPSRGYLGASSAFLDRLAECVTNADRLRCSSPRYCLVRARIVAFLLSTA